MKKLIAVALVIVLCLSLMPAAFADDLIKVGVVNNPPSESGYREANVNDFINVFTKENGYDASFFYSIKNDEQLSAARQFITDGVDYLLISAAETTGWDAVLKDAQEAGIGVFLFDRMIDCDPALFEAAVVSDMAKEGETAVGWLLDQKLNEYNVIHIQGAMGSDAQLGRTGALDEQFDKGTMKKVVQQTATWDEAEAKKIVEPGTRRKPRRSWSPSSTPAIRSTSSMPRTTAWPRALSQRWTRPASPTAWTRMSS